MEIGTILFDLDGTLIDTYRLYMEAYRRALAPVIGFAPSDAELLAHRPFSERGLLRGWVGEERLEACHAELCRHYHELHPALAEGLYDGVREMLAALRAAAIPLGIVTAKGRAGWETTTRHLDLGEFAVVVTEDDVAEPKPHPGGLLSAVARLGAPPHSAVYIGDSLDDLRAGRAAGMPVGAALWPKTAPGEREAFLESIGPLEPEWIFERPGEVVRAFAAWC